MNDKGGIVNGVSEVGRVEGGFVNDVAQEGCFRRVDSCIGR